MPGDGKAGKELVAKPTIGKRTWMKFLFGIGEEHALSGQPESRLIYPLSYFSIAWLSITGLFLAYTAVVTPAMISFHWLDPECAIVQTLIFDCILDCFFLIDILLTFNTGVVSIGDYIDNRRVVTLMYLKGDFLFDCVTSIPVSFFELAAEAACAKADGSGAGADGNLRFIRAIKPLRWLKIARVMKVGKAGPVANLLLDHCGIAPQSSKTFKVALMLVMTIHLTACVWWLWKVVGMCPAHVIDSKSGGCAELDDWLDSMKWGGVYERNALSTMQGKIEVYVISVYLVTMTVTTVGYGDINADNTAERVGYVLLFVVGAFVWGNLLAVITEIHGASAAREQEVLFKVQSTMDFLIANECPTALRTEIIQWTRFSEDHHDDNESKREMIALLPPNLQRGLVRHLYSRVVSRVPVFSYLESVDDGTMADQIQEHFINQVFILFEYKTFTPEEVMVNFADPADRLVIIVSGKVQVEFEHSTIDREPVTLGPGQFFGDMSILGEKDWAVSTCFNFRPQDTGENTEIKAQSQKDYVVTIQLTAANFQNVYAEAETVTKAAIQAFITKWKDKRGQIMEEMKVLDVAGLRREFDAHADLAGDDKGEPRMTKVGLARVMRAKGLVHGVSSRLTSASPSRKRTEQPLDLRHEAKAQRLLARVDANKDGEIDFHEFCALAKELGDGQSMLLKVTRLWEILSRGMMKKHGNESATGERDQEWNFLQHNQLLCVSSTDVLSSKIAHEERGGGGPQCEVGGLKRTVTEQQLTIQQQQTMLNDLCGCVAGIQETADKMCGLIQILTAQQAYQGMKLSAESGHNMVLLEASGQGAGLRTHTPSPALPRLIRPVLPLAGPRDPGVSEPKAKGSTEDSPGVVLPQSTPWLNGVVGLQDPGCKTTRFTDLDTSNSGLGFASSRTPSPSYFAVDDIELETILELGFETPR
jgi:CRP-like cAMP-binding protein